MFIFNIDVSYCHIAWFFWNTYVFIPVQNMTVVTFWFILRLGTHNSNCHKKNTVRHMAISSVQLQLIALIFISLCVILQYKASYFPLFSSEMCSWRSTGRVWSLAPSVTISLMPRGRLAIMRTFHLSSQHPITTSSASYVATSSLWLSAWLKVSALPSHTQGFPVIYFNLHTVLSYIAFFSEVSQMCWIFITVIVTIIALVTTLLK